METRTAKLFKNGSSQAVRLPAEFRFEGKEVFVSRNEATGDVVLSSRPGTQSWGDLFSLIHSTDVPDEFMADRPMNVFPQSKGIFDDSNLPMQTENT